jgi:hypothetical protein
VENHTDIYNLVNPHLSESEDMRIHENVLGILDYLTEEENAHVTFNNNGELHISFPTKKPVITLNNITQSLKPMYKGIGKYYTGDGVILRFQKVKK